MRQLEITFLRGAPLSLSLFSLLLSYSLPSLSLFVASSMSSRFCRPRALIQSLAPHFFPRLTKHIMPLPADERA